jgi:hypothetical protein
MDLVTLFWWPVLLLVARAVGVDTDDELIAAFWLSLPAIAATLIAAHRHLRGWALLLALIPALGPLLVARRLGVRPSLFGAGLARWGRVGAFLLGGAAQFGVLVWSESQLAIITGFFFFLIPVALSSALASPIAALVTSLGGDGTVVFTIFGPAAMFLSFLVVISGGVLQALSLWSLATRQRWLALLPFGAAIVLLRHR